VLVDPVTSRAVAVIPAQLRARAERTVVGWAKARLRTVPAPFLRL
jgi:hypothetical protein